MVKADPLGGLSIGNPEPSLSHTSSQASSTQPPKLAPYNVAQADRKLRQSSSVPAMPAVPAGGPMSNNAKQRAPSPQPRVSPGGRRTFEQSVRTPDRSKAMGLAIMSPAQQELAWRSPGASFLMRPPDALSPAVDQRPSTSHGAPAPRPAAERAPRPHTGAPKVRGRGHEAELLGPRGERHVLSPEAHASGVRLAPQPLHGPYAASCSAARLLDYRQISSAYPPNAAALPLPTPLLTSSRRSPWDRPLPDVEPFLVKEGRAFLAERATLNATGVDPFSAAAAVQPPARAVGQRTEDERDREFAEGVMAAVVAGSLEAGVGQAAADALGVSSLADADGWRQPEKGGGGGEAGAPAAAPADAPPWAERQPQPQQPQQRSKSAGGRRGGGLTGGRATSPERPRPLSPVPQRYHVLSELPVFTGVDVDVEEWADIFKWTVRRLTACPARCSRCPPVRRMLGCAACMHSWRACVLMRRSPHRHRVPCCQIEAIANSRLAACHGANSHVHVHVAAFRRCAGARVAVEGLPDKARRQAALRGEAAPPRPRTDEGGPRAVPRHGQSAVLAKGEASGPQGSSSGCIWRPEASSLPTAFEHAGRSRRAPPRWPSASTPPGPPPTPPRPTARRRPPPPLRPPPLNLATTTRARARRSRASCGCTSVSSRRSVAPPPPPRHARDTLFVALLRRAATLHPPPAPLST